MKTFLLSVVAATFNNTLPHDDKCRVLTLRGGGTKGAYEVGALKAMSEMLDPIDIAYDVIEGVSIGGMNAGLFATYPRGQEKDAIAALYDLWETYGASDLWDYWPMYIEGLLWKNALFDSTGMHNMTRDVMEGREFQRSLIVQSVDLSTGEVIVFDETTPKNKQYLAMVASASIPIFFPAVDDLLKDHMLVDGGIFSNLELDESILKCREKGFEDHNIIVDIILCMGKAVKIPVWSMRDAKYKSAWDMKTRRDEYTDFYYYYEDITRVVRGYPNVHFRHLMSPRSDIGGGYIPIFDGVDVNRMLLKMGEEDTRKNLEFYFNQTSEASEGEPEVQSISFDLIR